ncbi:Tyrosine-protein phosphatase domain-containing protein [Fusarium keratoplasticum]|uniref:Tyrosine-protein phosphatase domain-containing protein n=1 Tax=Fusarium keratoplasticum TaxID=1328300 RepID=A0ACC0QLW7_9HYPO|nr:Tyrosine-protein phosphatase domain-containing protein [Fusarium keratoplasticum]KAI8660239.1 Tyrosine-protein phosphatase domain-containing protein [Fusarium keratoplasticum]
MRTGPHLRLKLTREHSLCATSHFPNFIFCKLVGTTTFFVPPRPLQRRKETIPLQVFTRGAPQMEDARSVANMAVPSAPYTFRPPSPPFIHIPPTAHGTGGDSIPGLLPSYENVDPQQLTPKDVAIITQNVTHAPTDRASDWSYEQRREAQPLLNFLYLGPNSAARDGEFLRSEGITMVLVARDARMAGMKLMSIENVAKTLGIVVHYVDMDGYDNMISSFSNTIRAVNDHLLAIYHSQAQGRSKDGSLVVEPATFRRGKVLVACETGNDRSAAMAAAYIMALFGKDMITTIQFISVQRFCCCFDEDVKRKLQSWEDILRARSQVASQAKIAGHGKRHIDEVMETQGNSGQGDAVALDHDRFQGRDAFVPFMDM